MPSFPFAGIHGFTVDAFREAVRKLVDNFEPISLPQVVQAVRDEETLPEKACLVTFDDGLKCQYETALPVLQELGVPAAFFVSGGPYDGEGAAMVHRLQCLRANWGDHEVLKLVNALAPDEPTATSLPADVNQDAASQSYRYDTPETARLKYYLNYIVTRPFVDRVLDVAFEKMGVETEDFVQEFYMTPDQITALAEAGMLGSHAMTHRPLAMMPAEEAFDKLSRSRELLQQIGGKPVDAVSYPLGNRDAVSREVAKLAARAGYVVGYTMERACNANMSDPLLYARIDARDIDKADDLVERTRYYPKQG
jgi:peptidoglycan/xylan/chitin deacetylase (PgdA/CDA1 family)